MLDEQLSDTINIIEGHRQIACESWIARSRSDDSLSKRVDTHALGQVFRSQQGIKHEHLVTFAHWSCRYALQERTMALLNAFLKLV